MARQKVIAATTQVQAQVDEAKKGASEAQENARLAREKIENMLKSFERQIFSGDYETYRADCLVCHQTSTERGTRQRRPTRSTIWSKPN